MTLTADASPWLKPRLDGSDSLIRTRWPDLPEWTLAQKIHRVLLDQCEMTQERLNVKWEENIFSRVRRIIHDITENQAELAVPYSISPYDCSRLVSEPDVLDAVVRSTVIRSSRLWPFSILVYGWPTIEEISITQWDRWIVDDSRGRHWLTLDNNPFAAGGPCSMPGTPPEEMLTNAMRAVLQTEGINGSRELSISKPVAEASFGQLCRISCSIEPVVSGTGKFQASVRVPGFARYSRIEQLVEMGCISAGAAQFMEACVKTACNLIVAGGTLTGKTTWLRIMCGLIPARDRVVVIEDSAELRLEGDRGDGQRWNEIVFGFATTKSTDSDDTGIDLEQLVRHGGLRYAPDRIILGEARGPETGAILNALNTGHGGSMLTIHADSAELTMERVVDCAMTSRMFKDNEELARRRAHQAFDVVMHIARYGDGTRRVTSIVAVGQVAGQFITVYSRDDLTGELRLVEPRVHNLPPRLRKRMTPIFGEYLPE